MSNETTCTGQTPTRSLCALDHGHEGACAARKGRPVAVMGAECNPFDGPAHIIAAAQGVSAATVYKWRRERPEMKPAPVERKAKPRGRPPTPADVFAVELEGKHPGSVSLCASNAPHASIGRAYGVTFQAVQQWRERLRR